MCRASPCPGGLYLGSVQNVQARRVVLTLAEHVGSSGSLVFTDAACILRRTCIYKEYISYNMYTYLVLFIVHVYHASALPGGSSGNCAPGAQC